MRRGSKLAGEDEREIAGEFRRIERELEEILSGIPVGAEAMGHRGRRQETTVSGRVDRIEGAVAAVERMRPRPTSYVQLRGMWAKAQELRWTLAMSGYRIAVGEARKLAGRGIQQEDLVSEGIIGLLDAAKRFDPDRGLRFSTYARWWVRARMMRAIDTTGGTIRVPGGMLERFRRIEKIRGQLGGDATDEDLAEAAGLSLRETRLILQSYAAVQTVSLSVPSEADARDRSRTLEDMVPDPGSPDPERIAIVGQIRERIREYVGELPPHQQAVVQAHLGLGESGFGESEPSTLQEAGNRAGLSRERVRQVVAGVAERVRKEEAEELGEPAPQEPEEDAATAVPPSKKAPRRQSPETGDGSPE